MDVLETENSPHLNKGKWEDVTKDFMGAVRDLKLGELLHDESFGLFEAMSAIEMMDPKMDAGMLCNRGLKSVMDFDEQVQQNILKTKDLSSEERIGIIDETLACVVSWLEGHSLAQTVFINLYLHKPYEIDDKILKVFCLAVYKLLEIIRVFIHKAMVYEEEDFQPMVYGYQLVPDISEQRMTGMIREVEEDLARKIRNSTEDVDGLQAEYSRMKFIRALYQALLSLWKDTQGTTECQRLLVLAKEKLAHILSTIHMGIPYGTGKTDTMGFEPLINQRLLPPTFPRYTKIKTREEAVWYFEAMIDRLKVVCRVPSGVAISLNQVLEFFMDFSRKSPCILSRSCLQIAYPVGNTVILVDSIREALKSFISPPSFTMKSVMANPQAKHFIDSFLMHCAVPFANYLQLCGHNRARQRDKLAHLLEEFSALQDEAERVDAFLHNLTVNSPGNRQHLACFGTWILYNTLRIMIMYLLAGFELQLYLSHEFHYIYWYLYEFLYGWLISALKRADSFLAENELMIELAKGKGATKKKPKNKKKPRPYSRDIAYFQGLQNMCGGYYKALLGFRSEGKLSVPQPQFDKEQVRYEHRFAPFQSLVTPPPVQYSEFREMTSLHNMSQAAMDPSYRYLGGVKHFHQARQLLEALPQEGDIPDLLRICKTNFVVLKLLAGGHKKDSASPPEFCFTYSQHFPIIKLT